MGMPGLLSHKIYVVYFKTILIYEMLLLKILQVRPSDAAER
jgi:hypothetical protein